MQGARRRAERRPRGYQVQEWKAEARRHAWRLKPSTLAVEGRPWCHARRLKPSSLADEDMAGGHARRLKPSTLAGEDWPGRRAGWQRPAPRVCGGRG